jgi:hypothetical protein
MYHGRSLTSSDLTQTTKLGARVHYVTIPVGGHAGVGVGVPTGDSGSW